MENKKKLKPDKSHQLKDQICETLRYYHYAYPEDESERLLAGFVAQELMTPDRARPSAK